MIIIGKLLGFFISPHPPVIIPEVGLGEDKKVINTADSLREIAKDVKSLKPQTIIMITPHGPVFRDAVAITDSETISGDMGEFKADNVRFDYNIDALLTQNILFEAKNHDIPTIGINKYSVTEYGVKCELDHGSMVPLYFINKEYTNYKLVHITYGLLSRLDLYKFGMAIQKAVLNGGSDAVVIASGDLSHRLNKDGPYPFNANGAIFDKNITSYLENMDIKNIFTLDYSIAEGAGECGLRSFLMLLGCMNGMKIKGEQLSYESPFGVGYGVFKFNIEDINGTDIYQNLVMLSNEEKENKIKNMDIYTKLAKDSLEYYVKNGDTLKVPSYAEKLLPIKKGVFVSLHKNGELRGCIGTIYPSCNNVAEEIIQNAVSAGQNDPRFFAVQKEELPNIEYSVDILTEPEKCEAKDLNPEKYGVIVRLNNKTGLLLPNINGIDSVSLQLENALKKADILPNQNYSIERFEVQRHK